MAFKIKKDDIKRFRNDYDNRHDSHVIENAVTKNGVRNASFNWHAIKDNDPHFSIDLRLGTSPTKSNPAAAGCLLP